LRILGQRRGAYFFVLDAFIAGLIIISSIALMLSAFSAHQSPSQGLLLAEDYATFLAETEIASYIGPAVHDMVLNGTINDTHRTLLEQIVVFYHLSVAGDLQAEGNMTLILEETSKLVPDNTGLEILIYASSGPPSGTPVYSRSTNPPESEAQLRLSSHRIVASVDDNNALIGPFILEVGLWR